jgi:hypothetical protein
LRYAQASTIISGGRGRPTVEEGTRAKWKHDILCCRSVGASYLPTVHSRLTATTISVTDNAGAEKKTSLQHWTFGSCAPITRSTKEASAILLRDLFDLLAKQCSVNCTSPSLGKPLSTASPKHRVQILSESLEQTHVRDIDRLAALPTHYPYLHGTKEMKRMGLSLVAVCYDLEIMRQGRPH